MKKWFLIFLTACILFSAGVRLSAENPVKIYFNGGAITDDSFSFEPFLWFLGTNVDIHMGEMLMLSPEANVITYNFKFDSFVLQPAVLLNLRLNTFFVGGGLSKNIVVTGDLFIGDEWDLKLNAGFSGENLRLRVFLDTPLEKAFDRILVGFQVGFGF